MGKVIKKLRELTNEELEQQLLQSKKEMLEKRFESVTGHMTNVKQIKNLKRKVARILTLRKEHELKKKDK